MNKSVEGGWIVTYTGKKFWPMDPRWDDIDIIDIAHALSNICRFTGHVRKFYSVAQHSYFVSLISGNHALCGLLHDASEAYLCDMATPVKHNPVFAPYRAAERFLQSMILLKCGIETDAVGRLPFDVLQADKLMGILEGKSLMPQHEEAFWTEDKDLSRRIHFNIDPWSPKKAEEIFLVRFSELYEE